MPDRHNRFVHLENIREFEKKLETETDPDKRILLERLLADERAYKLPGAARTANRKTED